ncbi:unnamed protein product [Symbiodinium sp. CCMP2456]|nr:unnamed protein product [Symbiodinium sp. CCMP2456]
MEDAARAPFMLDDSEAPRGRRFPRPSLRQVAASCLLLVLGLLLGAALASRPTQGPGPPRAAGEASPPSSPATTPPPAPPAPATPPNPSAAAASPVSPGLATVETRESEALAELRRSLDRLSAKMNVEQRAATISASAETYVHLCVNETRRIPRPGGVISRPCVPEDCDQGDLEAGMDCHWTGDTAHCQRMCRRGLRASYADASQNPISCSDVFTGRARDHMEVVSTSLEWTASSSHFAIVDLWGGGGGGTGTVVKNQQRRGINVGAVGRTGIIDPTSWQRYFDPSGLYFPDADSAGNARFARWDDVFHLSYKQDCQCWKFALNAEYFTSAMEARLTGAADEVPLGDGTWSFLIQNGEQSGQLSLKSFDTSYGICGGSGGAGAHVRALVEVKGGHTYRIEAGRGGRGSSGRGGAADGQSSRMLEKGRSGEWRVLAEAGGGSGAGSFDGSLNFFPGGRGGTAPKLPARMSAVPGQAGTPSRYSLLSDHPILSPENLGLKEWYSYSQYSGPERPKRLFPKGMSLTCSQPQGGLGTRDYSNDEVYTLPPRCRATNARCPARDNSQHRDYFLTCSSAGFSIRGEACVGAQWPQSPPAGQGATGVGLAAKMRSGWGGNGGCPQIKAGSKTELQAMAGGDGHNGSAILRRCKREGAYTLALQRCPGSHGWTIHGLWPRGVRNCDRSLDFDVSALSALQTQLSTQWPSCSRQVKDAAFWEHEWQKHGTCFGNSLVHYFELTLRLLGQHSHACDGFTSKDCWLCLTENFELCDLDS